MTYPHHHPHLRPIRSLPSLPQPTSISQLNLLPNPLNPHQHPPPIQQRKRCAYSIAAQKAASATASPSFITSTVTDPQAVVDTICLPPAPGAEPATLPLEEAPNRECAVCHTFLGSAGAESERFNFPRTAPFALAAVDSVLRRSEFWHPCCSIRDEVSSLSNVFCRGCWIRIYDLSICWSCGVVVGRGEEKVGYGWCWWHWGCLGCLFCRVPLPPPPWTDNPNGITLTHPPICKHCASDLEYLASPSPSLATVPPPAPLPHIHNSPTNPQPNPPPQPRPLPKWMSALPSNRLKTTPSPISSLTSPSTPHTINTIPKPPSSKPPPSPSIQSIQSTKTPTLHKTPSLLSSLTSRLRNRSSSTQLYTAVSVSVVKGRNRSSGSGSGGFSQMRRAGEKGKRKVEMEMVGYGDDGEEDGSMEMVETGLRSCDGGQDRMR